MKKRIIATFAILALFALAIAAFAYTKSNSVESTKSCCCKKADDSCPMKSKGHDNKSGEHEMSCCKKHGEDHAKGTDHAKTEGHSSCDCCGDSCPMKKKDGAAAVSTDGKSCCDDCECCKDKAKTAAV